MRIEGADKAPRGPEGLALPAAAGFKPHLADLGAPRQPVRAGRPLDLAMSDASPWWAPHVHAGRRPALLVRNRVKAALRRWFMERGFVEVEAAALQVSPGNEAHLHAFATELRGTGGGARPLYLHTSPEFAMK